MKKIRREMFETNSSMVHALCICTPEEFERFKNGELLLNRYSESLVKNLPFNDDDDMWQYYSYEQWVDEYEFETFKENHTLKDGTEVVAFGYYGHD